MIPRPFRTCLFLALAGVSTFSAHAMSVQPPSFNELVAEADNITRARVKHVEARFVTAPDGQRLLKTFVTFAKLKTLKGAAPEEFTLEFLGGEKDGERWTIPGMPQFESGDEEFLFPTAGTSICPLVGAMHGRYRVLTDPATQRRYVARDNLEPLASTDDVSRPIDPDGATIRSSADAAHALTPDEFERRIVDHVKRPSRPQPAR